MYGLSPAENGLLWASVRTRFSQAQTHFGDIYVLLNQMQITEIRCFDKQKMRQRIRYSKKEEKSPLSGYEGVNTRYRSHFFSGDISYALHLLPVIHNSFRQIGQ